ncbi:hypothetical protein NDU88_001294 [Pleurodeles waltl]|uniref:Uncharacterized protein n=1 Tax=Pleurodeles waltl TaxID=8319 RepID=A0AAV7TIC6_PLEWA|nr:hypothetical protein NDU88_001294 [Pleurodeles waltl]
MIDLHELVSEAVNKGKDVWCVDPNVDLHSIYIKRQGEGGFDERQLDEAVDGRHRSLQGEESEEELEISEYKPCTCRDRVLDLEFSKEDKVARIKGLGFSSLG